MIWEKQQCHKFQSFSLILYQIYELVYKVYKVVRFQRKTSMKAAHNFVNLYFHEKLKEIYCESISEVYLAFDVPEED